MSDAGDLRRIALSLPGTTEAPHFDRTAFRAARIFATLAPDGRTANLMYTPEEQDFACRAAPHAFHPVAGGWGRNGATTVTLAALTPEELEDALRTAWHDARPRARARRR